MSRSGRSPSFAAPRPAIHSISRRSPRFAAPPVAIRLTKRAINQWLRLALIVAHDYSFALEKLAEYSGERTGAPYTDWPPRLVP